MTSRVNVDSTKDGTFTSECEVAFTDGHGAMFSMFVDRSYLDGSHLLVKTIGTPISGRVLVEVPGELFSGGSRIFLPSELVI